MPGRTSPNFQERVAQTFALEADKMAQSVAEAFGKPSDSQTISTKEELALWNQEGITPEEASELFSQGVEVDEIMDARFPNRRYMYTFQKPDPEQQIKFAKRMAEASKSYTPDVADGPDVHNESAGELQSTLEPY